MTTIHGVENGRLQELSLPSDFLIILVMRDGTHHVPNGETVILPGDLLVAAAREFEDRENLTLREVTVDKNDKRKGCPLSEIDLPKGTLIVMIERDAKTIIPCGSTVLREGDLLVVAHF